MSSLELDKPSQPANKADAPAATVDKRGNIYTLHAREGVNAAELINSALKKRTVGSKVQRRIEVIAPSGPSTSGGKRARQSITLAPVAGQTPALMLGYLDVVQKQAELRTYERVAKEHKARFHAAIDIKADELVALIKELTGMLNTLGFSIVQDQESDADDEQPRGTLQTDGSKRVVLIASVVVAVAVVLLLMLRR